MLKSWNKRHDVLTLYLLTTLLVPNFWTVAPHGSRASTCNTHPPPQLGSHPQPPERVVFASEYISRRVQKAGSVAPSTRASSESKVNHVVRALQCVKVLPERS